MVSRTHREVLNFVVVSLLLALGASCPRVDPPSSSPDADFIPSRFNPVEGEPVKFTDLSSPGSAPITTWIWTFGDGATSTTKEPEHAYASVGKYDVILEVRDSAGKTDKSVAKTVMVGFVGDPTLSADPYIVSRRQSDVDMAIGSGITRDELQGKINVENPIFSVPREDTVDFNTGTNDPRYETTEENNVSFEYIDSIQELRDYKGYDVNVDARYLIANASFNTNGSELFENRNTYHKIVFRILRDYGWSKPTSIPHVWELERAIADDLRSTAWKKLGAHYVFAERRYAALYVEAEINTGTGFSRSEAETSVSASINAAAWDLSVSATFNSLRESFTSATNIKITLRQEGGKPIIVGDYSGQGTWAALQAEITKWQQQTNENNAIQPSQGTGSAGSQYGDGDTWCGMSRRHQQRHPNEPGRQRRRQRGRCVGRLH